MKKFLGLLQKIHIVEKLKSTATVSCWKNQNYCRFKSAVAIMKPPPRIEEELRLLNVSMSGADFQCG